MIPRVMPGDPVTNLLGENLEAATTEEILAFKTRYGLDRPLARQYLTYLSGLVHLDFGYSITRDEDVKDLIGKAMGQTLVIVLPAVVMSGGLAFVLGVLAGYGRGGYIDRTAVFMGAVLFATPPFFMAMVFISIFSDTLGLFPMGNLSSGQYQGFYRYIDILHHLTLPVLTLAVSGAASKFFVIRSSVIQILDEYFIFFAKARGYSHRTIAFGFLLKNVLPQFIGMMALSFGFLVSGSLLIEIIFSLEGMGRLLYDAVLSRDYPVLHGGFFVLTVTVLIANFSADLLYGAADPRIRDANLSPE